MSVFLVWTAKIANCNLLAYSQVDGHTCVAVVKAAHFNSD